MTTNEERYKAALERIASGSCYDLIGKAPSQVAREALTPVQEFEEVERVIWQCEDENGFCRERTISEERMQYLRDNLQKGHAIVELRGVRKVPIKPKVRIRKRIDIKGWADWRFRDGPEKAPLPWKRPIEFFAEWEE